MKDLIDALTIFLKYKNLECPTFCEHDTFFVHSIPYDKMSKEDIAEVERLSFIWCEGDNSWRSYRFGSG